MKNSSLRPQWSALAARARRRWAIGLVLAASALLTACGGGGGGGSSSAAPVSGYPGAALSCGVVAQRDWLRDYMSDQYFWYDRQGTPNEASTSIAQYLSSLLYAPTDRYSYAQSTAEFTQFFAEGRRTGYGYALAWADAARTVLKVRAVEPLSPVALAGLVRGDTIVSIDGFTPAQINNGLLAIVNTVGIARTFVVADALGVQRTLSVNSADFALTPVLDARVLTATNGAKVGYLAYQEFITSGAPALGAAFNSFRTGGVTELVLDLRYNGGGSTLQARNLASMAGGSALSGQVFAQYRFNAKNAGNNFTQAFTASLASLPGAPLENLTRVFVITSASTASASEMVINGLRGVFKNVITVGGTTFGKPYAFQPRDSCGTTYSAVNLDLANAQGFSNYSAGFAPTCTMSDDLTRQFGDPSELRIGAALSYIVNGVCPPVAAVPGGAGVVASGPRAQAAARPGGFDRLDELGLGEVGPRQAWVD